MCGIICKICRSSSGGVEIDEQILQRIMKRGPDCTQRVQIDTCNGLNALFIGAVLWMQGPEITVQPRLNDNSVLLYNGDIFDKTWKTDVSDTQMIMDKLTNNSNTSESDIIKEIKAFKGPFSIIFYNKKTNELYFTRDRIGRSTLLFHRNDDSIIISSVLGRKYKCAEIPATHIHILNLTTNTIRLYAWDNDTELVDEYDLDDWFAALKILQSQPDNEFVIDFEVAEELVDKDNIVDYIENICNEESTKITIMKRLMNHEIIKGVVMKLTELLAASVKIRLEKQPQKCKYCLENKNETCDHCAVGILFSGGLDCTILAVLVDKYLPKNQSIDLINVAFRKDDNGSYEVPDRLTGRQSFQELKDLCKSRQWIFKEINVPKDELEKCQKNNIGHLVYPRQTILDESLGSALWFAARGQDTETISPCRVLILGSGADELFGGYVRHRNAYKRKGWTGLSRELLLDWKRISFRNLARDNRVICDHGRQPRMPYLDEDFTDFVLNLKPWLKCFPSENLENGIGDKLMLRLLAMNLGLTEVVTFPKRALQFGSRIANNKEKGSDVSKNLSMQ